MSTMYSLKPVFDLDAKVEVPSCMYSLPVIQASQPILGVGVCSDKVAAPGTDAAIQAISVRQDAILARLGQLKDQVNAYKQSLGLPPVGEPKQQHSSQPAGMSSVMLKMTTLKKTLARVELMFSSSSVSSSRNSTASKQLVNVSRTADLVVRCSPSSPALSLPAVFSLLTESGLSVHTSSHTHSSITGDHKLSCLLPVTDVARATAQVRLTLIWTEVDDCELMVSPLTQTVIKGEVNMLRYLARLFPSILSYENDEPHVVDSLLDSVSSLRWVVPRSRQPLLRTMASRLSKGGYLTGPTLTIADLALYTTLQNLNLVKELQPELSAWFQTMDSKFGVSKKDKSSLIKKAQKNTKTPVKDGKQDKSPKTAVKDVKKEKSPSKTPAKDVKKEKSPSKTPAKDVKKENSPAKKVGKENVPPPKEVETKSANNVQHLGKEGLFEFFSKNGIKFTNIDHPEVFTVEAMMPHLKDIDGAIIKNLFLKDKKKNLYLLSAVHDREVKLTEVAKAIGTKDLRFGDESVMFEKLGVSQGSVTAYALVNDKNKSVKFIVDEALLDESFSSVNFHPMVNTATTNISTKDFAKMLAITGHTVLKF